MGSLRATGAHIALAKAGGLKPLIFSFSFFFQIYQIPRCLTLKQRLQIRPTSRLETSQVGRCLHLPARVVCAVAGAGMQGEAGACGAALHLYPSCEERRKKEQLLDWIVKRCLCFACCDKMLFVG